MATAAFSNSVLKAKFRGCMIGALIGDCLGEMFEIEDFVLPPKQELADFMNSVISGETTEILLYTDDTKMTLAVASSLADKGKMDSKDMAQRFVSDYFTESIDRGYGTHVRVVFHKLKEGKYKDIFLPASEQFNGMGSFGNGAAMRIAPIALFGSNKGEEYIVNAAKECSLITHFHQNGYRGAILQCLAVNAALQLDPSQELNPVNFINGLLEKMERIETGATLDEKPYCESLKKMREYFLQNRDVSSEEIAETLGNGSDVSALKSVPTAIYSFLRGMKPFKDYFKSSNPFMSTIYFAISVGGDTDTIATMAGAIAGAYYGESAIPGTVEDRCESLDDVILLADKLFDAVYKKE